MATIWNNPTPDQIRSARLVSGKTQTEAAEIIGRTLKTWWRYEKGQAVMCPILWEHFLNKTEKLIK